MVNEAGKSFSPTLLSLIREREEASFSDQLEVSEEIRKVLEENGVYVDPMTGSWCSRGGWRGELGRPPLFYPGTALTSVKRKKRGRHIKKKSTKDSPRNRHKVFCEWLVENFGREALSRGCGVLDIAGGKGLITAELQENFGIPCTLIELKEAPKYVRNTGVSSTPWRKLEIPVLIGQFEELSFQRDADASFGPDELPQRLRDLCTSCSMFIGMHPDEATEPIVTTALSMRKPFAVVPCCVFPKKFPERKLPDGSPVQSYEDFLQYLSAKHRGIRRTRLNFYGRSEVLYWSPT